MKGNHHNHWLLLHPHWQSPRSDGYEMWHPTNQIYAVLHNVIGPSLLGTICQGPSRGLCLDTDDYVRKMTKESGCELALMASGLDLLILHLAQVLLSSVL